MLYPSSLEWTQIDGISRSRQFFLVLFPCLVLPDYWCATNEDDTSFAGGYGL